jgi:hypothetical protein
MSKSNFIISGLPNKLREQLETSAQKNMRSISAEIVYRLQLSFDEVFVDTPVEEKSGPLKKEKSYSFDDPEKPYRPFS